MSNSSSVPKKLLDFEWLVKKIFCISNRDYQDQIWVRHEKKGIIDSYDDTTMYFLEDAEAVIEAHLEGRVEMTKTQLKSLKALYERVEEYDFLSDRPETDAEIVNDPRWIEISEFAKEVYEELTEPS